MLKMIEKNLEELKSYAEFREWWDEFSKTIPGDRRKKQFWKEFLEKENAMESEWHRKRDEFLESRELPERSFYVESDIASIKLISESGNSIFFRTGSDGSFVVTVVEDESLIPSTFKPLDVAFTGNFKIMEYDCFKNYEEGGRIISGNIEVYKRSYLDTCEYLFLVK